MIFGVLAWQVMQQSKSRPIESPTFRGQRVCWSKSEMYSRKMNSHYWSQIQNLGEKSMLYQKQRKSTHIIRLLVTGILAFGIWFHSMDAYGMGSGQHILGSLESVYFGFKPVGYCVNERGYQRTGLGVEAVSFHNTMFKCESYESVLNLENIPNWCSTWVVPNAPNECDATSGGGVEICVDGPEPEAAEFGEEGEVECTEPTYSPILLDLDRNQFHLSGGPVLFDIDADGQLETNTWVAPGTQDAFLFLDRNGNGVVDDGSELFGNATSLISGEQAKHGYEALEEFDLVENGGNQDGVIDDADSIFSDLEVWIDSNANGIHESFESQSLAEADVLTIGLNYRESRRTDSHGNEFRYIGGGSIEVDESSKYMWTTDVFFKILAD
jgi:hypothetical protein